ncbi:MAG: lacto-N-biose phosphorylase central domain-containing protein [Verrucomicrobiae bacterium]|nr:lacto-N-biose phosphorylase central domain-containing protein [Verrucomicrobiae bacterium]
MKIRFTPMRGCGNPDSSLSILTETFSSRKDYPFSLGATGLFCMPLCKSHWPSYRKARKEGMLAMPHLTLCFDPSWSALHPDHTATFYLLTDKIRASRPTLTFKLTPISIHRTQKPRPVNVSHDPKKFWYAYDRTAGRRLRPDEWHYDPMDGKVTVFGAARGHLYQLAYLVCDIEAGGGLEHIHIRPENPAYVNDVLGENEWGKSFFPVIDPLCEEYQDHSLGQLEVLLREWHGYIGVLRILLSWRYPTLFDGEELIAGWDAGGNRVNGWNWYGYARAVHPYTQRKFERIRGVKFDLDWLARCHFGQIKAPPTPEYLEWQEFVRGEMTAYWRRLARLCGKWGVGLQYNIGDNWIGLSPNMGDLEKAGFHSVAKYGFGDAVSIRNLADFSGKTRRTLKIWLSSETGSSHYGDGTDLDFTARKLLANWNKTKKSLFHKMVDELRWEAFFTHKLKTKAGKEKEKAVLGKITREYLDYRSLLLNQEIYRHPLTVCVVNAWGRECAWTGWGDDAGPSQNIIQTHLLDLPAHINWLSLKELSLHGVPRGTGLLLVFGEKNTAWSGGDWWKTPGLAGKVDSFVRKGGGLMGIDAPGWCGEGRNGWKLGGLLGVDRRGDARGEFDMEMAPSSADHWIVQGMKSRLSSLATNSLVAPVAKDVQVLYAGTSPRGPNPLATVREQGRGRTGYLSSYGTSPEYHRLLHRMIFWLAGKSRWLEAFDVDAPNVFLYYYPAIKTLIAYNMNDEKQAVNLRMDFELLPPRLKGDVLLYDRFKKCPIRKVSAADLAQGVELDLAPWEAKFIEFRFPALKTHRCQPKASGESY